MVAREIEAKDERRTIEVVRVLSGTRREGEKITLVMGDRSNQEVRLRGDDAIYFLMPHWTTRWNGPLEVAFITYGGRLPLSCEADVVAAIKRRNEYPVHKQVGDPRGRALVSN